MDFDRTPQSGDILFFESSKVHGWAIARQQRQMGLEHYRYMHAALVIDGDLIVESITVDGVRKVRLSTVEEPGEYLNTTVLRRPSDLAAHDPEKIEETLQLAKSAYYFYREAYDFRGIVNRDLARDGKSICSVFVKKTLLLAGRLPATAFAAYRNQIFPAELFGALLDAGYRVLENGYDAENWTPSALLPMDLFDVLENSRSEQAKFGGLDDATSRIRQGADKVLEDGLLETPPQLMKYIWSFKAAADLTVLGFIHHRFDVTLKDFEHIGAQINKTPASWRDRSGVQDSLLLLMDTTVKHCRTTIRFVGAFLEMVPSTTTRERISQLEHANKPDATQTFTTIALLMSEVFLVTGTTDLDHLDSKIRESRAKIQAYKEAAASYPVVKQLDLPLLDDVYESPIELIEKMAKLFRSEEQAFGEPWMDRIIATARTGAERTWKELERLRSTVES